eukprot:CAMPEP_0204904760 /NCGR_PEP_ID=MMETSP1397-20131031/5046_1 /ASSEMBLY_ACC=CAM_ASM_000891 /TAXON_ID=49980 /ORGANISM="Climacostomum Climacostomum virens, Strain Stock W-24" /LENGTH=143 /DNA_ID=CAMNT_0052073579 /DNA_START=164 /DNA_END=591 /DNA_ORIENTATION=-
MNNLLLCNVSLTFTIKVRRMALFSMLPYDQSFMDLKSDRANELINILTVEAEKLYSMEGPVIGVSLMVVVALLAGSGIAIWHDWLLGIVFSSAVPMLLLGLARGFVQTSSLTNVNYQSNRALASDVILNVKQVYSYNLQDYFL